MYAQPFYSFLLGWEKELFIKDEEPRVPACKFSATLRLERWKPAFGKEQGELPGAFAYSGAIMDLETGTPI